MVCAPARPYRRAMTPLPLRRISIAVATALVGVCMSATPALAGIPDGTSNTVQVTVAHGTQVGSEGIIAILIGLRH